MTRLKKALLVGSLTFISLLQNGRAFSEHCTLPVAGSVYAEAVNLYRNGQPTAAARELEAIEGRALRDVLRLLERDGWTEPCVLAAALLHTELGMRSARDLDEELAGARFDQAWRLTETVRTENVKSAFQRNWLLVTALFYQKLMFDPDVVRRASTEVLSLASVLFGRAESHFDRALAAFPRDAEILLAAGTLFEWSGTPGLGEPSHLQRAEELYESSCRLGPGDPVAQLRLATVRMKRAEFDEARTPLRRVLELPSDDETKFRAHMALGRLAEREERYAEAIAHYRSARKLKPDWQIAYVALSHVLHAVGDRTESRRVLRQGLQLSWTDGNLFGWWSYETGLVERFGALLDQMREQVSF